MTACVCARCEAIVTTDKKIPTTPTKIPTRRVLGSAACSGVTSISGMTFDYPQDTSKILRRGGDVHLHFEQHMFDVVQRDVGEQSGSCDHACKQRTIHRRQHPQRRGTP